MIVFQKISLKSVPYSIILHFRCNRVIMGIYIDAYIYGIIHKIEKDGRFVYSILRALSIDLFDTEKRCVSRCRTLCFSVSNTLFLGVQQVVGFKGKKIKDKYLYINILQNHTLRLECLRNLFIHFNRLSHL